MPQWSRTNCTPGARSASAIALSIWSGRTREIERAAGPARSLRLSRNVACSLTSSGTRQGDRPRRPAPRPVRSRPLRRAGDQGSAEHPWREKIADIAERPNVAVKVSAWSPMPTRDLDGRRHPPLCRARDRKLRLGSRRLGQRLAGLHPDGVPFDLGGDGPRDHPRLFAGERERLFNENARRIWRLRN